MSTYYPIMLKLSGKRCVVIGGGAVAERKVAGLLEGGADKLVVVAPEASAKLQELASAGSIVLIPREYRERDVEGAFLLIAATNDPQLNAAIADHAESSGVLVNTVDHGESGSFITPAIVRRDKLVIALTTGGASPALTALLKRRLAEQYGQGYGEMINRLHALRKLVQAQIGDYDLRAAVLRLAAEEILEAGAYEHAGGADKSPSEQNIQQWMMKLLLAAERGC